MATMAEHNKSMTIFYYKSDGAIHSYCTGISDMDSFAERKVDYEQIVDFIVMEKDQIVIEFLYKFYVDVENKQLKLKPEFNNLSKYL